MQIACPNCRQALRAPDSRENPLLRCPSCQNEFRASQALPFKAAAYVDQMSARPGPAQAPTSPVSRPPSPQATTRPTTFGGHTPTTKSPFWSIARFLFFVGLVVCVRACPKIMQDKGQPNQQPPQVPQRAVPRQNNPRPPLQPFDPARQPAP